MNKICLCYRIYVRYDKATHKEDSERKRSRRRRRTAIIFNYWLNQIIWRWKKDLGDYFSSVFYTMKLITPH
jgi:hypothetical protein